MSGSKRRSRRPTSCWRQTRRHGERNPSLEETPDALDPIALAVLALAAWWIVQAIWQWGGFASYWRVLRNSGPMNLSVLTAVSVVALVVVAINHL
jgi:hypothetical protein